LTKESSPGERTKNIRSSDLPTQEEVLDYIENFQEMPTKRQITKAFHIKGEENRRSFKALLKNLEAQGFYPQKKKFFKHEVTHQAVFEATVLNADGELLAKPLKVKGRQKILLPHTVLVDLSKASLPLKGLKEGDMFLGAISSHTPEVVLPLKLMERSPKQMVGRIELANGIPCFIPAERTLKGNYRVQGKEKDIWLVIGQFVVVEFVAPMHPQVRILKVLGEETDVSLLCAYLYDLPLNFSEEALQIAEHARVPSLKQREDIRSIPLVTIDGKDARDFDDAVFAEPDTDPKNPGGWHLIVAIADVAHYVHVGSALDKDAFERGTSTYFPDRVLPMLPERLSNGLCSLNPGEDRGCMGVHIWIDQNGVKKRHRFFRGLMKSAARLTYEDVEDHIQGKPHPFGVLLAPLYGAYQALLKARKKRGVLELEIPELKIVIGEKGEVKDVFPRPRLESYQLIEEFMVAANVSAAQALATAALPCMYRIHDSPSFEKVNDLKQLLKSFNVDFKGTLETPSDFNKLLAKVEGEPYAPLFHELILRSQSQAVYSPNNIGHFGLNLQQYCHFTSPIRRYADLLVHRALLVMLGQPDEGLPSFAKTHFEEWGREISMLERRSVSAERDAQDRYLTLYLSKRVGESFETYVSGISRAGLFVTIQGLSISGLVPMEALTDDFYIQKESPARLVGRSKGRVYAFGDSLKVILKAADITKGRLTFGLQESQEIDFSSEGKLKKRPWFSKEHSKSFSHSRKHHSSKKSKR
jgi:ribonuclease R